MDRNPSNLALRTFLGLALRFAGLSLQLATGVMAARLMGPQMFGGYVLAHTLVLLAGGAMSWGQAELALRVLPSASASVARRLLGNTVLAVGMSAIAGFGLFAGLDKLGVTFRPGWIMVGALMLGHGACLAAAGLLSALSRVFWVQIIDGVIRPGITLLLVAGAAWQGSSIDATTLFGFSLVAAGLSFTAMSGLLFQAWPKMDDKRAPTRNLGFLSGLPLLVSSWTGLLLSQIDLLVVGLVLGDAALGLYRVASRAAGLVALVQQVATQVLGPRLSKAIGQQNCLAARSLLQQSALAATVGGIGLAMVIFLMVPTYLHFLGSEYTGASLLIYLLTIGQLLALPFGAGALVLILRGAASRVIGVNIAFSTLGALSLSVAAIPWGPLGVGTAMSGVLLGYRLCLRREACRSGGPDPSIGFPPSFRQDKPWRLRES